MNVNVRVLECHAGTRGALIALAAVIGVVTAVPAVAGNWHTSLTWRGREARVARLPAGGYLLQGAHRTRKIGPQRFRTHTASPMFDALFAMAQADLRKDSVRAIEDPAFNHGKPIPCRCFIAGKDWPFAWTRDLSYSTDLALWRFDPRRA
ncbi:MAG: Six-hairpin glycosidase-like protein, partial [Gallionella sp.]|nr:Six-hairpin glycosidase-like protein [Gallionella sp.]